jgi:multidrug efflux pump subunit AcrB
MMGPFMRPIPINAPVAMLVSLATAYIVVPRIAWRWLRGKAARVMRAARRPGLEERGARPGDWLRRAYLWAMAPLIDSRARRGLFFLVVLALLGAAMLQPLWQYLRPQGINGPLSYGGVQLKMLPDDNTNTFLVELDAPADTPLATTDEVTRRVADLLAHTRYVTDLQAFVGNAAPPDFAALVRGDPTRSGTNFAQMRVNLVAKEDRRPSSHEIAQRLDRALAPLRAAYPGTRIKLYETPPGPPVRAQMLAELYGPDYARLRRVAGYVRAEFARVYGMINVDDSVSADAPEVRLIVDKDKATLAGLAPSEVARVAHDYLAGFRIGALHREEAREPRTIVVRLPESRRGVLQQVLDLRLLNREGRSVPLGAVVRVESGIASKPIYDKDQHPVVYVSGEMLWSSPVPAVIDMQKALDGRVLPDGTRLSAGNLGFVSKRPDDVSRYRLDWGGEMRLTLDVFRDLGSAFIVALLFIYLLLAGYYESLVMPFVVMGAIPLTLVGVFPGHWLLGQPFTATSMIGVIALAGVVVRNSLLLIDFILEYRAEGHSLRDAVMEAGAVRFRPILLTALAIVSASFIMVSDPVFGGLAISLIFGTVASTALTLLVIPLIYYLWQRRLERRRGSGFPTPRSQGETA